MQTSFKKRLKKLIGALLLLFVVLFFFRLAYGYTKTINPAPNYNFNNTTSSYSNRNYASKKYEVASANASQITTKVDQKYEKVAEIKTTSTEFEAEEKQARQNIKRYNALIQFEQKSGNKGNRTLSLVVGVPPENFDSLYNELIKIGTVLGKQITKKDKTNEYKELNAKKQSLEKIRASLIDLKSKGGKIEEYMGLENRILEIEQQLQDLGVSLGDFDDENEFCTVQFALNEGRKVEISLLHRVKVALEWTVKIYFRTMMTLVFLTLFAYLMLLVIDKSKLLLRIFSRNEG